MATKTGQTVYAGIKRIAEAIAKAEGFGVPGAIPTIRHNPGNIRSLQAPYPIATYSSDAEGWAALYKQVGRMVAGSALYPKGWTIEQVAQRYTGEARYMDWARNVARELGVPTTTVFSELA
jgi:hypothetical protein